MELNIEQNQINFDDLNKRYSDLLEQITSLQNDNQNLIEQIQQHEITLIQKDEMFKVQQDLTQQSEQRYLQLEEKHQEQHDLMLKVFIFKPYFSSIFIFVSLVINTFSCERK